MVFKLKFNDETTIKTDQGDILYKKGLSFGITINFN